MYVYINVFIVFYVTYYVTYLEGGAHVVHKDIFFGIIIIGLHVTIKFVKTVGESQF